MTSSVHASADLGEGLIVASVELAASPERVFRLLASEAITDWWVRPGVFDTREWTGEVRPGGRWRAAGVGGGEPYVLEGEFLVVDAPQRLVHTWHPGGMPEAATTVTYVLQPRERATHIALRHEGFASPEVCRNTCSGWETSFAQLEASLR